MKEQKIENENEVKKEIGRMIANGYEGFQTVRISAMNRIRVIIRRKVENLEFSEVEAKKEEKDYSKKYKDQELFDKLEIVNKMGKISNEEYEYLINFWNAVIDTKKVESQYKKLMESFVKHEPIYIEFLSKIRGLGPVISANLIAKLGNCETYDTVSKLWAHTGNSVIEGIAPKRKKGETIHYDPKLRTLTYIISESLMKLNKGYYRKVYLEEKTKQLARIYPEKELSEKFNGYEETDTTLSKGHAHSRALRKIRKLFLAHYWEASRTLAGLPIERTYVEGVLDHTHIVGYKDMLGMENCLNSVREADPK